MVTSIVDFAVDSFDEEDIVVSVLLESVVFDASVGCPLLLQDTNKTMAAKPMSSDFLFRMWCVLKIKINKVSKIAFLMNGNYFCRFLPERPRKLI
jgi:hypothetical protein